MPKVLRDWKRLGLCVIGPAEGDYFRRRAAALKRIAGQRGENDTSEFDLLNAAAILEQLANSPKAMTALSGRRSGPRGGAGFDMALDALAQRELEGPGRTDAADFAIAQAWGVTPGSVKDALTKWRAGVVYELSALVDARVGKLKSKVGRKPAQYWTREDLLRAISADIRDHNKVHLRKPRRTKKKVTKK